MELRPLPFTPAALPGLSDKLLRSHYQNNYGGAVRRLNAIRARLAQLAPAQRAGFDTNGLKREELIATNSVLLHELYFACIEKGSQPKEPAMALALAGSFGSEQAWADEFVAMGKAQAGGSGWVLLSYLPRTGALVNQWAADHAHALAGAVPVLALDMYEHAYALDHGAAAGDYVDAFMQHIDWAGVYGRYKAAVHGSTENLGIDAGQIGDALLIDVRRMAVFEAAPTVLPGSTWRDPAQVARWAAELPVGRPIVVSCVYGHEVGRSTAQQLCARGLDARFLRGGIDAWQKAGRALQPKATPP